MRLLQRPLFTAEILAAAASKTMVSSDVTTYTLAPNFEASRPIASVFKAEDTDVSRRFSKTITKSQYYLLLVCVRLSI